MAKRTLKDLAKEMKDIDICMFTTNTTRGVMGARPMSNNREVDYDGNSYYFTFKDSRLVSDIMEHPQVCLGFQGSKGLYISISGRAHMDHDKATMAKHWTKGLDMWFKDGVDTPGVVMVHVVANHIKYWQNEENGEVTL